MVFRIIVSKACKLNWKSKNVEYTFCWHAYDYCNHYLAVLKNEENEVLLRLWVLLHVVFIPVMKENIPEGVLDISLGGEVWLGPSYPDPV